MADLGGIIEQVRPWVSTGALVGLLGLCVKLYLDNRRISLDHSKIKLDGEDGIRDHYATEVASLRRQILDTQKLSDERMANAEKRYAEAISAADSRHRSCEQECDRLREKVLGLERQIEQIHRASLKLFTLRDDLSEETKQHLRSLEQAAAPLAATGGRLGRRMKR
jgi:predicted  nucleic acid-binding Zn-ribbon protein